MIRSSPPAASIGRRLTVALATAGVLAATTSGLAHADERGPGPACREVSVAVALAPGAAATATVAGTLCVPRRLRSDALQVLVPGIPFDRAYWDFPGSGGLYSYVGRARRAGVATLALDRLGTGRSSRPAAAAITVDAQAYALDQVVRAARRGTVGAPPFARVVTIGFSVGSAVVLQQAGTYQDVDGIVLTGFAHSVGPSIQRFSTIVVPAAADPVTAAQNPPADYLTVTRDAQALFGFSAATSTARVRAAADAAKTTFAGPEGDGFARVIGDRALSGSVRVPVLSLTGRQDSLFCTPGCPESAGERQAYGSAPDVEVTTVALTAHNLQLHLTAPFTDALILSWFAHRFGTA
jgi:pimeloyl-ACP methyl ester carboxylesterase